MTGPVRPYGQAAADLDVAFAGAEPEDAATALLAACTGCEAAVVHGWTLARRLQALLDVRLADDPAARVPAVLRCTHCRERFEIEFDLARCRGEVDEARFEWLAPDGQRLLLRLPTAADVESWRRAALRDEGRIAAALLANGESAVPEDWLGPLSDALAERDPYTAWQVDAPCPDCGHVNTTDIDLQALVLADFAARQRRLLDDVATLAGAFHWSEAQILELPRWRRAHYIARIEGGALR